MAVSRVYVDTSVFGGVFDKLFSEASQAFFAEAARGRFRLVVSAVVRDEIAQAPEDVQDVYRSAVTESEVLAVSDEALHLRDAYVEAGVVGPKWNEDALHVALATVSQCVMIVSWNFKHIVNFRRIPQYNAINAREGYGSLAIYSPLEVTAYDPEA